MVGMAGYPMFLRRFSLIGRKVGERRDGRLQMKDPMRDQSFLKLFLEDKSVP